ncbi:MAG: VRR-NUC domain-containing protein [Shewanella sp.]
MKESDIQRLIMLALSEAGCVVWRNNCGVLKNAAGIPIKFGLCVGSSDLIGIAPGGRFLAVEIKTPTGKATPEQIRFIEAVRARGGIAGVVRSPSDALALLSL